MARTIKEIANGMKASFVQHEDLSALYGLEYNSERDGNAADYFDKHFPAPSVESVLIWIVAACVAVVENMMDWHKKEIDTKIARERYGHAGWYEQMALKFQYGDGLNVNYTANRNVIAPDGNFAESTEYATVDPEKQIVKYAYCEENKSGMGVTLKVAGGTVGAFEQLDNAQLAAFDAYINRIKPAGIPVRIISDAAETLTVKMTVYYDPLVLKGNGERISGGRKPVEEAVQGYLNSIGFNGEFTVQAMVDALQEADGVKVVGFEWAKADGVTIRHRHIPESGCMELDFEDCEITYEAYVKVRD